MGGDESAGYRRRMKNNQSVKIVSVFKIIKLMASNRCYMIFEYIPIMNLQ